MNTKEKMYCGIDVSADTLDVCVMDGKSYRYNVY